MHRTQMQPLLKSAAPFRVTPERVTAQKTHGREDWLLADDEKAVDMESAEIHLEAARFAGRLVDMPASELHTTAFADIARDIAAKTGADIQVLEGESLAHAGMGGLWGVGKAAVHPPTMVIPRAPTEEPYGKTYGWVGKGIVYDTGGLSIKSKAGMFGMKMDMGGPLRSSVRFGRLQLNLSIASLQYCAWRRIR